MASLVAQRYSLCPQCGRLEFDPWVRRSNGEGNGNPLQYSSLENSVGYNPWCRKELDTTSLSLSLFTVDLPCTVF